MEIKDFFSNQKDNQNTDTINVVGKNRDVKDNKSLKRIWGKTINSNFNQKTYKSFDGLRKDFKIKKDDNSKKLMNNIAENSFNVSREKFESNFNKKFSKDKYPEYSEETKKNILAKKIEKMRYEFENKPDRRYEDTLIPLNAKSLIKDNKNATDNDIINSSSMPEKNEPKIESPEKSTLSAEDLKLQQDLFVSAQKYGTALRDKLNTNRKNPRFKNDLEIFNKSPYESLGIELNRLIDNGVNALEKTKSKEEKEIILNRIVENKITLNSLKLAINKNITLKQVEVLFKEKEKSIQDERNEIITKIGQMLRQGVDKVVIHGQTIENGDEVEIKPEFGENIDTDTRGALYFLSLSKGVKYKEGSYTQLGFKGSKVDNEEPIISNDRKQDKVDTTLYIDTSGENLSYKIGIDGKEIFIDHHHKYDNANYTSATELMYEVLTKNKMIKSEPWMKNMVDFVTNIDNLSYANDKRYNLEFLKNKWPESIIGIYKNVPFSKITQWFKEGRDPFKPEFTEADLNEVLPKVELSKDAEGNTIKKIGETKLLDIINDKRREIGADISNAKLAIELMKAKGIKLENERLGKVLYNLQDRQQEIKDMGTGRNPVNKIYNGFLVTKALGLDSYVTYQNKYNRFLINTNNHNLRPIYEEIKKIVPETVLVRGVMLMQPQGLSKRKEMTEDKFLNLLGLKNEVEKRDMPTEQITDFEKLMKEIKLKKEKVEEMKAKEEEIKNYLKKIEDAKLDNQNKITQNRLTEYIDFEDIKN
ncbi:MAG: hypothetical protein KGI58_00150 [Patescibacteria group bacterium]|nr:hypothetical protein [Patescibacteria group bacterium]